MKIIELLTPVAQVPWIAVADSVRDALDHMDSHELGAAPILDAGGRYVGTVTMADFRRHLDSAIDRAAALATPLSDVARRSSNACVSVERDVDSVVGQAATHPFIPVVDATSRLVGIVDRRRVLAAARAPVHAPSRPSPW